MITPLMLRNLDITSLFGFHRWNRPIQYDRKTKDFIVITRPRDLWMWGFLYIMRNVLGIIPAFYISSLLLRGEAEISLTEHAAWVNGVFLVMFLNCSEAIFYCHSVIYSKSFQLLRRLEEVLRKGKF